MENSMPPQLLMAGGTAAEPALPLPQLLPSASIGINRGSIVVVALRSFRDEFFLVSDRCRRIRIRRGVTVAVAICDDGANGTGIILLSVLTKSFVLSSAASVQTQQSPPIIVHSL
jgi:hypothetical protein